MILVWAPLLLLAVQSPGDTRVPPVTYPSIAREARNSAEFIPVGWALLARATGDLNGDKLSDIAQVLRMTDPRNLVPSDWDPARRYDSNPYLLMVAFAHADGGFRLVTENHRLIPRLENQNQDEPFDEISIVNGTLRVKMHLFMSAGGWRMGGSAYTFRWQDGGFKLIGFDRDSVMRNSGETEEVSINYLTGHKELKTGNIGTHRQQTRSVHVPRKPLLDLGEIGDGLMFDPDER